MASDNKIYISDWGRKAILSVSGGTVTTVMADVTAPMALFFTPVTKTVGESHYILCVIKEMVNGAINVDGETLVLFHGNKCRRGDISIVSWQ